MITVAVLGAIEAHRDGIRLDLPAGKTTELLVRLALEAGARVRVDALLEDLWGEPAGRNTLQSKVSQLRRALGDKRFVVATADGYTLVVDPQCVDALRVVSLAAASAAARGRGDAASSLQTATEGLTLFRGQALVDAGAWATAHRTHLEEIRLGLVEDVMAARLELGAGAELVAELESLVEEHPLREGLWSFLITALFRAGRQAEALGAYRRLRRLLVQELGIEPTAELRALEQQVLQQSPELGPTTVAATTTGNLPLPGTPMVGRAEDLSEASRAFGHHRLVTVVGPAGVGKTRLVLEVARQVVAADGVWLVRLDDVEPGADLAQVVADTLHVSGGSAALPDRLTGAGTVLVLDNCEHVLAEVARLVEWLLAAAPYLSVIATSQVPLGVADEHLHHLQPLRAEASESLFVQRARAMRRQFVLDDDTAEAVKEVCKALDGLPLAIELAASRVRSLSVHDIARRLDDRFTLLRDPTSERPERRRALAGAIAWSYELLFPDDQRGLWALSVFAGSASLDALEHVLVSLGVPGGSVLDTISRLVDRSLVTVEEGEAGAVRYRLLDSIRTYATERLCESAQVHVARAAHAEWYAGSADWAGAHIRGSRQPECVRSARAERSNVDAALAWCAAHDPALGVRIALGFGWTWVVLGDGPSGAGRVRAALREGLPPAARATGLLLAGWLEASAGDVTLAAKDLDEARALTQRLGDDVLLADVDRHDAFLAIQQGRPDVVTARATSSLELARRLEDDWRTAAALLLAAYGRLMVGAADVAAAHAIEAVDLLAPLGDAWGMVHAEAMIGGIAQAEHRFADAARALERAADQSATLGFLGQASLHRATLGRVQQRAGDPSAAASCARAIAEATSVGDGRLAATARLTLARLCRAGGDPDRARHLLRENARWYRRAGGGDFALLNRCLLGAATDDRVLLEETLLEARAADTSEVQVYALDALARLRDESGEHEEARDLLEESDRLAVPLGHVLDEADRFDAAGLRAMEGDR